MVDCQVLGTYSRCLNSKEAAGRFSYQAIEAGEGEDFPTASLASP